MPRTDAAPRQAVCGRDPGNGLDLDLHVDESDSHHARTLERVADAAIRHRFPNRILCGHCCSASLMEEGDLDRLIDKLARGGHRRGQPADVQHVSPGSRLRADTAGGAGWRRCSEFRTAGIPVMFASDNTRDPFFAYGDLDLIEVFCEATRIAHAITARVTGCAPFAGTAGDRS